MDKSFKRILVVGAAAIGAIGAAAFFQAAAVCKKESAACPDGLASAWSQMFIDYIRPRPWRFTPG